MKKYIIVGDNNYWYHTFTATTQSEIDVEIEYVKSIANESGDIPTCNEFFVYEVNEISNIKLN